MDTCHTRNVVHVTCMLHAKSMHANMYLFVVCCSIRVHACFVQVSCNMHGFGTFYRHVTGMQHACHVAYMYMQHACILHALCMHTVHAHYRQNGGRHKGKVNGFSSVQLCEILLGQLCLP